MSEYEIEQIISLIPLFVIGIFVGIAGYFSNFDKEDKENSARDFFKHLIVSSAICLIVYSILSATELPYLARLGVSCAFAFFGIDKALSIIKDIINLRGSKNEKH